MNEKKSNISFSKHFISGEFHLGVWSFIKKGVGAGESFLILSALSVYQLGVYQLFLAGYSIISDVLHDLFSVVTVNDIIRLSGEGAHGKLRKLFSEYSRFRLALGILPLIVVVTGHSFISSAYGATVALWCLLLSIAFFADTILMLATLLLQVDLSFKLLAVRSTLHKFAQLLVLGYFLMTGTVGITETLIAFLAGPVAAILFLAGPSIISLRRIISVPSVTEPVFIPMIRSYGKWEVPQHIFKDFSGKVRPFLIKIFLSTEAVGIFGVANTAVSLLKDLLPTRTLTALIPRMVGGARERERFVQVGTKYYVLASLALALCGAVGYPFVVFTFFPHLATSIPLFFLLLPILPLFAFIKIINILLVAKRRQRFIFVQMVLENVVGTALLLILLPTGSSGIAIAELLRNVFGIWWKYWYLTKQGFVEKFRLSLFITFGPDDRALFLRVRGELTRFLFK